MQHTIFFKYTSDEYGCLSNFSAHSLKDKEGKIWQSSEAWYQAQKFVGHPALQEEIRLKPTPKAAKVWAQAHKEKIRPDWQEVSIETMEMALALKVASNPQVGTKLLESGDAKLVERSDYDSFWGDGKDGRGRNELGQAWMRLRDKLRKQELFINAWIATHNDQNIEGRG